MAEPMMTPAATPPRMPSGPAPRQRASAGVGVLSAPTAMVATAARAKMVFFIRFPSRVEAGRGRPPSDDLKPVPALIKEAGLMCRKFDRKGSHPPKKARNPDRPRAFPSVFAPIRRASLVANPDAFATPAVAVPDSMMSPVTAWTTIIRPRAVIGRPVIRSVRSVIAVRGDAANDGARRQTADDTGGHPPAPRLRRLRGGHGRDGKGRGGRDSCQGLGHSAHGKLLFTRSTRIAWTFCDTGSQTQRLSRWRGSYCGRECTVNGAFGIGRAAG